MSHLQTKNASRQEMPYCSTSTPGATARLCEALIQNSIKQEVQSTPFPVSICHSEQDDVISFESVPDVSLNPNLSLFSFLGNSPTGSHGTSSVLCLFSFIIPFTSFGSVDANSIRQLDQCDAPSPLPSVTPSPTSPTQMPSSFPTQDLPIISSGFKRLLWGSLSASLVGTLSNVLL